MQSYWGGKHCGEAPRLSSGFRVRWLTSQPRCMYLGLYCLLCCRRRTSSQVLLRVSLIVHAKNMILAWYLFQTCIATLALIAQLRTTALTNGQLPGAPASIPTHCINNDNAVTLLSTSNSALHAAPSRGQQTSSILESTMLPRRDVFS